MKTVTINGCFDILHPGHEYLITEAKKIAEENNAKLIILLNSNNSVKNWKKSIGYEDWQNRPVNHHSVRKQNLVALFGVEVKMFSSTTPLTVLHSLKPIIHIKTEEYGYDCIERKIVEINGGKIVVIPHLKGFSTTKIIEDGKSK